jgi:hypothetical protein
MYTKYYFHSDGHANSRYGTGTLDTCRPGEEEKDSFVYDPKTPVPSVGGPICCTGTEDAPAGAFDQSDTSANVNCVCDSPFRNFKFLPIFNFSKVWMCGGQILIATCSRVGHVFRKVSPYSWPGGVVKILNHNTLRTVETWMDEYKEFYYKISPGWHIYHTSFLGVAWFNTALLIGCGD